MLTGNGLIVIIGGYLNRNMEINRKRGPTPWLLSVYYGCHLQLFSTPRTEDANEGREIVGTQSKF
jgi:hypothetical protein